MESLALQREKRLLNPRLGLNSRALDVEGEDSGTRVSLRLWLGASGGLLVPRFPGPRPAPLPQQGWAGAWGFALSDVTAVVHPERRTLV